MATPDYSRSDVKTTANYCHPSCQNKSVHSPCLRSGLRDYHYSSWCKVVIGFDKMQGFLNTVVLKVSMAISLLSILPVARSQEYPFRNTSLPFSQRVQVNSAFSTDCIGLVSVVW